MVETTLVIAPPTLPIVIDKEVQVAKLLALALPVELAIVEVAEEVEPIIASLLAIKVVAEVLPAITKFLTCEAVGEVVGKVAARKVVGKASIGTCKVTATPYAASPEMDCMMRLLPVVTLGSSSRLHGSPPYASQVPNPLSGRLIDCFPILQCL